MVQLDKATYDNLTRHTHSGYVKLTAFVRQQWFREGITVICYAYSVCLVSDIANGQHENWP
jgi:hypothetical protein